MLRAPLNLLLTLGLLGCELGVLSPGDPALNLASVDGLRTELRLDRTAVDRGKEFTATFRIQNTRSEDVALESLCVAIARGVVYREGERIGFVGSGSGCFTTLRTYEIDAGETFEWSWRIKAATTVRAYPDGRPPDLAPAEQGEYIFRVEPDVWTVNGVEARLPQLEQRFTVR